jgi:hypothetical protein
MKSLGINFLSIPPFGINSRLKYLQSYRIGLIIAMTNMQIQLLNGFVKQVKCKEINIIEQKDIPVE